MSCIRNSSRTWHDSDLLRNEMTLRPWINKTKPGITKQPPQKTPVCLSHWRKNTFVILTKSSQGFRLSSQWDKQIPFTAKMGWGEGGSVRCANQPNPLMTKDNIQFKVPATIDTRHKDPARLYSCLVSFKRRKKSCLVQPSTKKSDYVPVPFQAVLMTNTNTRAMHVVLALPALWSAPCAQFKHTTKPIRTRLAGHRATEVGRRGEGICPRLTGPANPLVIASGRVGVRIIVGTEDSSVVVARIRPGHQSRLVNAVFLRAQELCENGGGRPWLPSLIRLRFLWT